jgi:hypothetical protein
MTSARGDQKPCTHAGCSGTMQYTRQPLPQASSMASTGGEFGWACGVDPAHFQFPSERPPSEESPGSVSNMQPGDILISHRSAMREHEISVVPNLPHTVSGTHDTVVTEGRSEAAATGVDAWLTEDQTHVVKIASNRSADE